MPFHDILVCVHSCGYYFLQQYFYEEKKEEVKAPKVNIIDISTFENAGSGFC